MGMPGRTMTTGGHSGTYPTLPRATCGDVEGLSTREAAEITGVGQAAFKSRLHQARLRVRAALGDQALVTAGG
jgi:Sigma-70, region 4